MFGGINEEFLNENSELFPKSPYAAAKVFSHNMSKYIESLTTYLQ